MAGFDLIPRLAAAECIEYTRLQAFEAAGMVFYADVLQVQPDTKEKRPLFAGGQLVTFRVREWFKGGASRELTLPFVRALEGHKFTRGERVLAYVEGPPAGPWFAGCDRVLTGIVSGHPDLEFLRAGMLRPNPYSRR